MKRRGGRKNLVKLPRLLAESCRHDRLFFSLSFHAGGKLGPRIYIYIYIYLVHVVVERGNRKRETRKSVARDINWQPVVSSFIRNSLVSLELGNSWEDMGFEMLTNLYDISLFCLLLFLFSCRFCDKDSNEST